MEKILKYPDLKVILMVEKLIKESNVLLTREKIKKKLSRNINDDMLNLILDYLEESGKILEGEKGIVWVHNQSPKLRKAIEEGIEL